MKDIYKIKEDLYITNDDKIEEGDYGVGFAHGISGVGRGHFVFKHDGSKSGKLNAICDGAEKIIRTTDKALIADGVEAFEVDVLYTIRTPKQYTPEELEGFEDFKKALRKEQESSEEKLLENIIEKASEHYAHNFFDMHETNNYKALKKGFIAGAQSDAAKEYWFEKFKKEIV